MGRKVPVLERREGEERKTKAKLDGLHLREKKKQLSEGDAYDGAWWRRAVRTIDPTEK